MSAYVLIGDDSIWGEFVWGESIWGGDASYTLPECLTLQDDSVDAKPERIDLALTDGSRTLGQEIRDRKITISGLLICATREANRALIEELRHEVSKTPRKLRIDEGKCLSLSQRGRITEIPEARTDRCCSRLTIEWQLDDPFWRSETVAEQTFTVTGNTTITVDALDGGNGKRCIRPQHPKITITANSSGPGPGSVKLKNITDSGLFCTYSDPGLISGAVAEINSVDGTCKRGSANTIRYFDGEFLRLLTDTDGENVIEYTGGPATITFSWVPRWI